MEQNLPLKLHFESGKPEAEEACGVCQMHYGQTDLEKADVHVVLGGDGSILTAMHRQIKKGINIPIYGLNFGTVGRMCNAPELENLAERIQTADSQEIIPLQMVATSTDQGKKITAFAINEFSILRNSPQAVHLVLNVKSDKFSARFALEGDGAILSTPIGSTGYYANVGGDPIQLNQPSLGFHSVNTRKPIDFLLSNDTKLVVNKMQGEKRPIMIEGDGQRFEHVSRAIISSAFDKKKTLLFDAIQKQR